MPDSPQAIRIKVGNSAAMVIVPQDAPRYSLKGRKRTAEAVVYMTAVIRNRQESLAEIMQENKERYDWAGELSRRWYPNSGRYIPGKQYDKDRT